MTDRRTDGQTDGRTAGVGTVVMTIARLRHAVLSYPIVESQLGRAQRKPGRSRSRWADADVDAAGCKLVLDAFAGLVSIPVRP